MDKTIDLMQNSVSADRQIILRGIGITVFNKTNKLLKDLMRNS